MISIAHSKCCGRDRTYGGLRDRGPDQRESDRSNPSTYSRYNDRGSRGTREGRYNSGDRGTDSHDDRRGDDRRGHDRSRSPRGDSYRGYGEARPINNNDRGLLHSRDRDNLSHQEQRRDNDSDRSHLPRTDTYYGSGERQGFKRRDEKTGNLSSKDRKTNAAVKIVLGHWLDLQHNGYHAPKPKDWNIHATVSREYRRLFKDSVDHQMVFDLNAKGESTAHFLDNSWQKPKEAVHRFWRKHGAVAAPDLDFFLQSSGEAGSVLVHTQTPPNPIKQEMVDEGLALKAEPNDQQDVEAQIKTEAH